MFKAITEQVASNRQATTLQKPSKYQGSTKRILREQNQRSWGRIWPFWDHFWRLLGSRKLPKSEFERERLSLRFLVAFEGPFGPVLGAMLQQSGPHEVCFFRVLYHPKSISFSKVVSEPLEPSLDRIGVHFWRFFEAKIEANVDLDKDVKIAFSLRRESNFQCLEGTKKALNIDVKTTCQACCQELRKIMPKISQDGPKREPRWG